MPELSIKAFTIWSDNYGFYYSLLTETYIYPFDADFI